MATSTKFTTKQVAVLQAHYKKGMVGTGKADLHLVMSAAKKSKLSCKQVKVRMFIASCYDWSSFTPV